MADVFLEIVFDTADLIEAGIEGRDEIEDPLEEALSESELGEITGGGSGSGVSIIDVEIEDETHLEEALSLIRRVLKDLNVPNSTIIKRYKPTLTIYRLQE